MDNKDEDIEKRVAEDSARLASQWGVRGRQMETPAGGFSRLERREGPPRENPAKAHERHREENADSQSQRMAKIADPDRRTQTQGQVDTYYSAWGKGLSKAREQRFEDSERNYGRKIAEMKTDPRMIPDKEHQELRAQSVRDAVTQSHMRMDEINTAMPKMIDGTIDNAVALTTDRERAQEASRTQESRSEPTRDASRDKDPDIER